MPTPFGASFRFSCRLVVLHVFVSIYFVGRSFRSVNGGAVERSDSIPNVN